MKNELDIPMDHLTTGASVFCIMDVKHNESLEQENWTKRLAIPILARAPTMLTGINHGEGSGICLGLDILGSNFPKVFIMGSSSVCSSIQNLRDKTAKFNFDRTYIRKITPGVGKSLCGQMERNFLNMESSIDNQKLKILHKFLKIISSWIGQDKKFTPLESKILVYHGDTPIVVKVDSHQLNDAGTSIKHKITYPISMPNPFMLSCNQFADKAAGLPIRQFQYIEYGNGYHRNT